MSSKITFPGGQEKILQQLNGFGDENIFDEGIRTACKLEASELSRSFNPYDYGIVDAAAQKLLLFMVSPGFQSTNAERWGLVARLYKLNMYSGPLDKFEAHVDVPRGFTQFGSLMVCLPNAHEGNISMLVPVRY